MKTQTRVQKKRLICRHTIRQSWRHIYINWHTQEDTYICSISLRNGEFVTLDCIQGGAITHFFISTSRLDFSFIKNFNFHKIDLNLPNENGRKTLFGMNPIISHHSHIFRYSYFKIDQSLHCIPKCCL